MKLINKMIHSKENKRIYAYSLKYIFPLFLVISFYMKLNVFVILAGMAVSFLNFHILTISTNNFLNFEKKSNISYFPLIFLNITKYFLVALGVYVSAKISVLFVISFVLGVFTITLSILLSAILSMLKIENNFTTNEKGVR